MFARIATDILSLQLPLRISLPDMPDLDLGPEPEVTLTVHDAALLDWFAHPSLDTLAEAYVESRVDFDGPIMRVIEVADQLSALAGTAADTACERREHAPEEDAEAISRHYDLCNEFYALWLDPDMVYSCAYYETGQEDLATAQQAKMRHLCRKLRLAPGDLLLDVGCGWGGLSRFAAREFDVDVLAITLSRRQFDLAWQRIKEEGLQHRIQLELMDYRDLPQDGCFDKVVSVGMLEHVGHANMPLYMQTLHNAVRPGGLVMNHGITARHDDERQQKLGHGGGDFIDRHVFPGGEIPPLSLLAATLASAGLEVVDVESLRLHYARTLAFWSDNLETRLDAARALVGDRAVRIWRLYLAGCAYAFRRGWLNLHQVLCVRPHDDGSVDLPWSRRDIYQ